MSPSKTIIYLMPENASQNQQKPFNLKLEQAKVRFESAMHVIFGDYDNKGGINPIRFPETRDVQVDKAVMELFNSGAPYYKELWMEKLSALDPYSKEALNISEHINHYLIAAEYLAGVKSKENSKVIANNIFNEYVNEVKNISSNSGNSCDTQINEASSYIQNMLV